MDAAWMAVGWILGGSFLAGCVMIANAMHRETTVMDAECSRIDVELDETDRFYDDLARNVGI